MEESLGFRKGRLADTVSSDDGSILEELNIEGGSRTKPVELPKRIFVNRALRLDRIKWIGFDLDYTLALYKTPEYEEMTYQVFMNRLVRDLGYPESILRLRHDKNFIVRGVVVDVELGNILKLDSIANVLIGYHGRKPIKKSALAKIYSALRIDTDQFDQRYILINTSFDIPKATVFGDLIHHFEEQKGKVSANRILEDGKPIDYKNLWNDIIHVCDAAHQREMKTDVLAQPDRFLEHGDSLAATLDRLRRSGKKLAIITNSPWYYVHGVMRYLIEGKNPNYASWRDYFDIIVVNANKPDFFMKGKPFRELNPIDGSMMLAKVDQLVNGRIYSYGNLADMEKMCSIGAGNEVLYVGDHIFSDVLISKKRHGWRTLLIIPELERDLMKTAKVAPLFAKMASLQALKTSVWDSIDAEDDNVPELHALKEKFQEVAASFNAGYNKYFGSIFRTGPHSSFFAMQVSRYADLYTTSISNFRYYHSEHTFTPPIRILPHELDPILGDQEDLKGLGKDDLEELNEDEHIALAGGSYKSRPSYLHPSESPMVARSPRSLDIPLGSPATPLWYHNANVLQNLSGMPLGRDFGTSPQTDYSHLLTVRQASTPHPYDLARSHPSHHHHRRDHQQQASSLNHARNSEPASFQHSAAESKPIHRRDTIESEQKSLHPNQEKQAPISDQVDNVSVPAKEVTELSETMQRQSSALGDSVASETQAPSLPNASTKVDSPLKSINKDVMPELFPRSPAQQIPTIDNVLALNSSGNASAENGSVPSRRRTSIPLKGTVKIHNDVSESEGQPQDTVFQFDV